MPVPLHVHSWHSLLEGISSLETLLRRASACGYRRLALTDTNNLYGAVKFAALAKQQGIAPILGACLRQGASHCVALMAEPAGYRSVCRIISRLNGVGAERGARSAERLEDLLRENPDGLHVLISDAALAESLREAFGPRLWLEVIRPRLGLTAREEAEQIERCGRLGIRPIASTAAHFATTDEYSAYRLITAAKEGLLIDQLGDVWLSKEHHLVDRQSFEQRFHDLPEAVRNTNVLAEQLSDDVLPRDVILPPAKLPRRLDANRFLRLLCERGLRRRLGEPGASAPGGIRLDQELAIIAEKGLASYFLVVRDIARYARRRGYPMALRGSAGNSLVCFLLEITDVDPLRFGLPMERFLHAERKDLPDIDLDFDWKVRDEVIAHAFERYGHAHTAMISSHLYLQPRSAFREAAKVHGLSNEQISRLIETLEYRIDDRGWKIDDSDGRSSILDLQSSIPRGFPLESERWPRILQDARRLLGRPHHLSIHPGGIVITPGPIADHVPLQLAAKGIVITQFEKDAAEAAGLVKIDLLGNRALGTVAESAAGRAGGVRPRRNVCAAPPGANAPGSPDRATVELLQAGDTLGVNQLESPAMRHLLVQLKPTGLDHVIQALALIRPAAASIGAKERFVRRRRELEQVSYPHPCLKPVLEDTYGLMVYEDDSLRVIQALTGLAGPQADTFRKRIARHQTDAEALELTREFISLCRNHGIPHEVAAQQWVQLAKFNRYSFCKSHAVSYGLIAWRAAWLKAHRPLPFWTAALNNNQGIYPRRVYIEAIKRAGIRVLLPCVNRSAGPFLVEGEAIRTGLEAIGELDEELRQRILAGQPYGGLADFRRRVEPGPEALAILIRCGAFDFTGRSRPALFLEAQLDPFSRDPKGNEQSTLPFGSRLNELESWQPVDYSPARCWQDEWEILGFLTGPPLLSLHRPGLPKGLIRSGDLRHRVGQQVRLAGLVAAGRHAETEDGRAMQFVTLEDEEGLFEVVLFPGTPLVAHLRLGPYIVSGVVEEQYDVITVTAGRLELA